MICVLRVVEGPATGMKCWLKRDQRITIGRQANSDLSISDQHMSRTHMIIEGSDVAFRIRDTGSANGTYVNNSRISILELCGGDRIRAGKSVISVEFEDEQSGLSQNGTSVATPADCQVPQIPERTLSSSDLGFLSQFETARIPSEATFPENLSTEIEQTVTAKQPAVTIQKSGRNDIPIAWLEHFPVQVAKQLWSQKSKPEGLEPDRIIEALARGTWPVRLAMIINRAQLDESERRSLDFCLTTGEARRLTETLYLLECESKTNFFEFYRRCLCKDAVICIASTTKISNKWILEAIDLLSYPSMLYEVASQSNARASLLTKETLLLLFERNSDGELCILRSN